VGNVCCRFAQANRAVSAAQHDVGAAERRSDAHGTAPQPSDGARCTMALSRKQAMTAWVCLGILPSKGVSSRQYGAGYRLREARERDTKP
jgi:hypothetical protein